MVLAPDGSRVIVGGSFTSLSGTPAYGMGSDQHRGTGAILPWAANQVIRSAGNEGAITSLRTDGTQIFGTGYSFDIPTANFEGTFAADPTTGNITTVNDCHGDTYDVLPARAGDVQRGPRARLHAPSAASPTPIRGSGGSTRWPAPSRRPAPTPDRTPTAGTSTVSRPRPCCTGSPRSPPARYTGQGQAAWSLAGNSQYVVIGGEFPKVNGVAQQGLTRMAVTALSTNKRGPSYTTNPDRPVPPTTAVSFASGAARVGFGTAWDYDNESLTYDVFRDNGATPIYTTPDQVELLDAADRRLHRHRTGAGLDPHLRCASRSMRTSCACPYAWAC